jgi:hypothetical protein
LGDDSLSSITGDFALPETLEEKLNITLLENTVHFNINVKQSLLQTYQADAKVTKTSPFFVKILI